MGTATQRQIVLAVTIFVVSFCIFETIQSLSSLRSTVDPEVHLVRIAIALAAFFLPIMGGWFVFGFVGSIVFALIAAAMVIFVETVAQSSVFVWYLIEYGFMCFLLYRMELYFQNQIAATGVDLEKYQSEKNDLAVSYKTKGEGISILFEKYSTYYNLRKLAEELATTLSVDRLAQMVVDKMVEFVPRGDIALISLAYGEDRSLELQAYKQGSDSKVKKVPSRVDSEDIFDLWVVKNRRRLIVTDSQQDFRFDLNVTSKKDSIRSVVVAPLLQQGRVMGTLRINSGQPETFSNDDLRLIDTIAVLASSALSNAMLYEQTEELAIKDSLTGLYVRRYFFDRLKEEHRRALMTKRALSLLMCDLDYFKSCNDKYGHTVGDLVLTHFTEILKNCCENAIVGRFGGEEFSVLLTETNKERAAEIAEHIRKTLEDSPFSVRREKISITVSIGVASVPEDTLDLESLVKSADDALYVAKRKGRNRVCSSTG